jgi:membrane associated rhomboid family serine protease
VLLSFIRELITSDTSDLQDKAQSLLEVIAFLWFMHFVNWGFFRGGLNFVLGLRPRELSGLPGIFFSHFLHGVDQRSQDIQLMNDHLIGNTLVLAPTGFLIILEGVDFFYFLSLAIAFLKGTAVWIFGRENTYHVGFSGIIFGYFGFLMAYSILSGSAARFIIAVVLISVYQVVLRNILGGNNTSWEGHVFGLLSGIFMAYLTSLATLRAG